MKFLSLLVVSFCVFLLSTIMLFGSDHTDAPMALANPFANIGDLYAFVDGPDLILALTVYPDVPATVSQIPRRVTYHLFIDNDGDLIRDFQIDYNSQTGFTTSPPSLLVKQFVGRRDDPFILEGANGTDMLAIVVAIPISAVTGNGPNLGVWAMTSQATIGFVDRMGRPGINTLFIGGILDKTDITKNVFNQTMPKDDVALSTPLVNNPALVSFILPDILPIDPFKPVAFVLDQTLSNGRALEDDVVDVLSIIAGIALDTVTQNDKPFLKVFPYLAKPHGPLAIAKQGAGEGLGTTGLPQEFELGQAYPNPFNPSTTIAYALPAEGAVSLTIYNLVGQEVRTLVDQSQVAGRYTVTWDGKDQFGRGVASGIYLYRVRVSGERSFSQSRRMSLLK